jgi:hypothetical protein
MSSYTHTHTDRLLAPVAVLKAAKHAQHRCSVCSVLYEAQHSKRYYTCANCINGGSIMPDSRAAATHKETKAIVSFFFQNLSNSRCPKNFPLTLFQRCCSLSRATGPSIADSVQSSIVALRVIRRACRYVFSQKPIVIALGDLRACAAEQCVAAASSARSTMHFRYTVQSFCSF